VAASTITRDTWTNDTGTFSAPNLDGTVINNAALQNNIYARIDELFAGAGSYATLTFAGHIVVEGSKKIYLNDTSNANMTVGLTLNQGANDDEILALKSSDVAHGMTTLAETDTYAQLFKASATGGGLFIRGLEDGAFTVAALSLEGIQGTTADTTKSAGGYGVIRLTAGVKSGTTRGAVGADGNLVSIDTNGSTRFIFDTEGDMHYDGAAPANYDRWFDVGLLRTLDQVFAGPDLVTTEWDRFVTYNRADLERAGIVSSGGFVNLTKHTRLLNGAVWQLFTQMKQLEQRVNALPAHE